MSDLITFFQNPWALPLSAIFGIVGVWILNRIVPGFVKYEFDKRLEIYRREVLIRDKAAIISDVTALLQKIDRTENERIELNKKILDLCLYLPPHLIHNMAHTYCQSRESEDLNPLGFFVKVRQYIDGTLKPTKEEKKKVLTWDNIPQITSFAQCRPGTILIPLSTGKFLQIKLEYQEIQKPGVT